MTTDKTVREVVKNRPPKRRPQDEPKNRPTKERLESLAEAED